MLFKDFILCKYIQIIIYKIHFWCKTYGSLIVKDAMWLRTDVPIKEDTFIANPCMI